MPPIVMCPVCVPTSSNRSRDSAYAADGYGSPVRGVEVRGGRWHVSAARGCRRTPHMAHPSVMELAQIRLVVDDFVACFRFYRDVIGLTPQVDDERGPYAKLSADEGSCAVALQARSHLQTSVPELRTTTAAVDNVLIAFKVADLDACVARLAARGGHLVQEPTTAWGRMRVAYLRDPEGRLIELQQWLVSA
jgi:lactoylglutathione lyase